MKSCPVCRASSPLPFLSVDGRDYWRCASCKARFLEQRYDFVTCSEAVEHFFQPAEEFDRLGRLLRPGGWLAIMTCFQTEDTLFAGWHYRKDPTHVVFYREETMRHIAECRGWSCVITAKDVALMQKPGKLAFSLQGGQHGDHGR